MAYKMMTLKRSEAARKDDVDAWKGVQKRAFENWANVKLQGTGFAFFRLEHDMQNGVAFIKLVEQLTGESFPDIYSQSPKLKIVGKENLLKATEYLERQQQVKFSNLNLDGVNDGDLDATLNLFWSVVHKFEICQGEDILHRSGTVGAKTKLLEWVNTLLEKYLDPGMRIENFDEDWKSGLALSSLVNALGALGGYPELCGDWESLNPEDAFENLEKAIEAAYSGLGIPKIISPVDTGYAVDEASVMTYISLFRDIDLKKISGRKNHAVNDLIVDYADDGESTALPAPKDGNTKGRVAAGKRGGRSYDGQNLGGRGKIRVYYEYFPTDENERTNQRKMQALMEQKKLHLRPDFEPWMPLDVGVEGPLIAEAMYAKAGTQDTPLLFIDDEFVGNYDNVQALEDAMEDLPQGLKEPKSKGLLDAKLNY